MIKDSSGLSNLDDDLTLFKGRLDIISKSQNIS